MIDPKKIDFNQLPKKFIDGAIGGYGKEVFTFALTSGNNLDPYAVTPTTMKSIAEWMKAQVESYEEQFGTIEVKPSVVQSPIQISDLRKDDDRA
jgi:hypothetical protein